MLKSISLCDKGEIPSITTSGTTNITGTSVTQSSGEGYGMTLSFTTRGVKDIDGSKRSNNYIITLAAESGWMPSGTTGAAGNTDYPEKRNTTGLSALPGGVRDAIKLL